jgi:pSer/pThr/pTyr-binding forkhead associated (FHA) protein
MRIEFLITAPKASGAISQSLDLQMNQCTIGRDEVDLKLGDSRVSRLHAVLYFEGGRLALRDLGSSNGTVLNDEAVTEAYVKPGDEMRFGDTSVVLLSAEDESTNHFYPVPERALRATEEEADEPRTRVDGKQRIKDLGLITAYAEKKGRNAKASRPVKSRSR